MAPAVPPRPRSTHAGPRHPQGSSRERLCNPRELSTACIPASLGNPVPWENKPFVAILFCPTTVTKPRKLRRGDKKRKKRRHRRCPPTPSALIPQPSVPSGFCLSQATPAPSIPPERSPAPAQPRGWSPPATASPAHTFGRAAPSSRYQLREVLSDLDEHWGL